MATDAGSSGRTTASAPPNLPNKVRTVAYTEDWSMPPTLRRALMQAEDPARSRGPDRPDVDLELHGEQLSPTLLEMLIERRIDLAVVRNTQPGNAFDTTHLRDEPLVAALPADFAGPDRHTVARLGRRCLPPAVRRPCRHPTHARQSSRRPLDGRIHRPGPQPGPAPNRALNDRWQPASTGRVDQLRAGRSPQPALP